ncbi:MAG: hypothetical protein LBT00_15195 [Spirochaetaceae bacterium]|nr:hypothetical protein [Spirochaetaceae bacterium]
MTRHLLPLCGPFLSVFFLSSCIVSCENGVPASFPLFTENGREIGVIAHSKEAASGLIGAKGKKAVYAYSLPEAVPVAENASFLIDYTVRETARNVAAVTPGSATGATAAIEVRFGDGKKGGPSWQLPLDVSFLGLVGRENSEARGERTERRYRYAIPLDAGELDAITISAENIRGKGEAEGVLIYSFSLITRFYGFDANAAEVTLSPFVYREIDAASRRDSYIIDPAEPYPISGGKSLRVKNLAPRSAIKTRAFGYESSSAQTREVSLPAGILGRSPYPVTVDGGAEAVLLSPLPVPDFPVPLAADPGVILDYPQTVWRNDDYEVFRWESFPTVLIFDTADYAVQDKLFKRLAFFTEKKGYRGRLVPDDELAGQHGWNAHDYRAEDLAAFYELARRQNFPLLPEERFLKDILIDNGILTTRDGSVSAGEGAVVSVSRESNGYLRRLFMAHECFHGIYFVDEDFRAFTRQRYDAFDPVSKKVIISYFDYQSYDITDEYLVFNEFMAHLLQQGAGAAAEYFGKTIPERLEKSEWRRPILPQKDEAQGTWPHLAAAFDQEARAFSAYVSQRWPLAAGRVWLIE